MFALLEKMFAQQNAAAGGGAAAPAAAVVGDQWQCLECTFINSAGDLNCEMCGTPKPLAAAGGGGGGGAVGGADDAVLSDLKREAECVEIKELFDNTDPRATNFKEVLLLKLQIAVRLDHEIISALGITPPLSDQVARFIQHKDNTLANELFEKAIQNKALLSWGPDVASYLVSEHVQTVLAEDAVQVLNEVRSDAANGLTFPSNLTSWKLIRHDSVEKLSELGYPLLPLWSAMLNVMDVADTITQRGGVGEPMIREVVKTHLYGPGDVTFISWTNGDTNFDPDPPEAQKAVTQYMIEFSRRFPEIIPKEQWTCDEVLTTLYKVSRNEQYLNLFEEYGLGPRPGIGVYAYPQRCREIRGLKDRRGRGQHSFAHYLQDATTFRDDAFEFKYTSWRALSGFVDCFKRSDTLVAGTKAGLCAEVQTINPAALRLFHNYLSTSGRCTNETYGYYNPADDNLDHHSLFYVDSLFGKPFEGASPGFGRKLFQEFKEDTADLPKLRDAFESFYWRDGKHNELIMTLQRRLQKRDCKIGTELIPELVEKGFPRHFIQGSSIEVFKYLCIIFGISFWRTENQYLFRQLPGGTVERLSNQGLIALIRQHVTKSPFPMWKQCDLSVEFNGADKSRGTATHPEKAQVRIDQAPWGMHDPWFFDKFKAKVLDPDHTLIGIGASDRGPITTWSEFNVVRAHRLDRGMDDVGGHYQAIVMDKPHLPPATAKLFNNGLLTDGSWGPTLEDAAKRSPRGPAEFLVSVQNNAVPAEADVYQPNLHVTGDNACYIATAFVLFTPVYRALVDKKFDNLKPIIEGSNMASIQIAKIQGATDDRAAAAAAAAAASAAASAAGRWSCPACTFINPASNLVCTICDTPNPAGGGSAAPPKRQTVINRMDTDVSNFYDAKTLTEDEKWHLKSLYVSYNDRKPIRTIEDLIERILREIRHEKRAYYTSQIKLLIGAEPFDTWLDAKFRFG